MWNITNVSNIKGNTNMMLIVADKEPINAVNFLIENTDKKFCFKQLLELSQLLASCNITKQMKPIPQGKSIQAWIVDNKEWTYTFYTHLLKYVQANINLSDETRVKFSKIRQDLQDKISSSDKHTISNTVFRYSKLYTNTNYNTDTLLPITVACDEYKKYITKFKFREVK